MSHLRTAAIGELFMHFFRTQTALAAAGVFIVAILFSLPNAQATTLSVINTLDSGAGSLRQAITDANATGGVDTIVFAIPGSGLHTIAPASNLPAIVEGVFIDGYSQAGSSANTLALGD